MTVKTPSFNILCILSGRSLNVNITFGRYFNKNPLAGTLKRYAARGTQLLAFLLFYEVAHVGMLVVDDAVEINAFGKAGGVNDIDGATL